FWSVSVPARVVEGPWGARRCPTSPAVSSGSCGPTRRRRIGGVAGAATLLGTGSLRAMARLLGVQDVDGRRFRMNFGVDGLAEHEEDEWLHRRVRIGQAVVVPQGNVGRCAVTTQNPETGAPDLD